MCVLPPIAHPDAQLNSLWGMLKCKLISQSKDLSAEVHYITMSNHFSNVVSGGVLVDLAFLMI